MLCGFCFTYIVHRTCIFIRWILDFKYILLLLLLLIMYDNKTQYKNNKNDTLWLKYKYLV